MFFIVPLYQQFSENINNTTPFFLKLTPSLITLIRERIRRDVLRETLVFPTRLRVIKDPSNLTMYHRKYPPISTSPNNVIVWSHSSEENSISTSKLMRNHFRRSTTCYPELLTCKIDQINQTEIKNISWILSNCNCVWFEGHFFLPILIKEKRSKKDFFNEFYTIHHFLFIFGYF